MFTTPPNDGIKCLANFALSYCKRAKKPDRQQICHFESSFEADLLNICVKFGEQHTENDKI